MKTMSAKTGVKFSVLLLVAVLVLCPGCHKKQNLNPDLTGTGTSASSSSGDGLPNVDLENLLWNKNSGLKNIYFDFDSYALRPDALATLAENADKIKQAGGNTPMIQIEGHCDERGTQEYNLALGEKRALATREHLVKLGIPGDKLVTISYGEENPADQGHGESAWSKNRRCEFNKAM